MNDEKTKSNDAKLATMIRFSGMCDGQTGSKSFQELKKDKSIAKYSINPNKSEKFNSVLEKIKNADKEIIEEFDTTLLDGLD